MGALILTRYDFGETYTAGVLTLDGEFVGWALEDKVRLLKSSVDKVPGQTAIPAGVYKCAVTMSNRFKREMVEVQGVPYFAGIRIHGGNTSKDSEGCILVAANRVSRGMIQGSLEKLFTQMCKEGRFTHLKIVEAK